MTGTSIEQTAGVGEEAASGISQQDFALHMAAMQQHYRTVDPAGARPIVPYLLPAHISLMLSQLPAAATTKPPIQEVLKNPAISIAIMASLQNNLNVAKAGPVAEPVQASALMAGILHDQQQKTLVFINAHRDAMLQVIAAAPNASNTQAFQQQMDALRDRAKADHDARIDAMFASLTAVGNAHPPARPAILGAGNKVGGFVAGIAAAAANVAGAVKSAVAAGGSAVGKAAETVGNWASGAAQSVGHFFSSIF